jgi:hypothetical protein
MKKIIGIFIFTILFSTILPIEINATNLYDPLDYINQDIIYMLNQVNKSLISKYLEGLVEFGPRYTGTKSCENAAQYLYDEFEKLNLDVYFDNWNYIDYQSKNIIATHNGCNQNSDAIIIICAHYDTTETSPGANDDGSGVATMLTLANICSKYSFNHTIKFIAFSGEEVGTYGSHNYAKKAYYRNENIIAVLNLETFGYTSGEGKELFLLKTSRTEWLSQLSNEIAEKYYNIHNLNLISIGNRPCDHQAFLDFGYDAVQYVQLNRDDYPLHTPEDSFDKINFSYLKNVTKLILAIAVELANKPIEVQIKIVSPYEGYLYILDNPLIKLPGFNKMSKLGLRGMTYIFGKAVVRVNITNVSEIESVFFCIDGISEFYGECKDPPYEWKIQKSLWMKKPLIGKHTIGAYVWTKDKKLSYDEMDIFVITPIF